jgi:ribosomal protein S18 acetylase RimI-like enzyme
MIHYTNSLTTISAANLRGFFVGWPDPPPPEAHYGILAGSYAVELALNEAGDVVGFITAVSDGISAAYIPHLEVLPAYQGQGIGLELTRRLLARLRHLYMVDLVCDEDLQPFYARLGMRPYSAMMLRDYDRQSCGPVEEG